LIQDLRLASSKTPFSTWWLYAPKLTSTNVILANII
jgi:hypothetical protein